MLSAIRCLGASGRNVTKVQGTKWRTSVLVVERRIVPLQARRCFSTESDGQKKETGTPEQEDKPEPRQMRSPGQTRYVDMRRKRFLMLSGRWNSVEEIPDVLPEGKYNSDMWIVRIRLATFIMILWVITCLIVTAAGRKYKKEQAHMLVMEQYLEGLPKEERDKLREQYNLPPERITK